LEGTQQSGMPFELKIANIATDGQVLSLARNDAQHIIDDDVERNKPENVAMWQHLAQLHSENVNWASVS
jgi:ATP-dependent DNA helicase RecG